MTVIHIVIIISMIHLNWPLISPLKPSSLEFIPSLKLLIRFSTSPLKRLISSLMWTTSFSSLNNLLSICPRIPSILATPSSRDIVVDASSTVYEFCRFGRPPR